MIESLILINILIVIILIFWFIKNNQFPFFSYTNSFLLFYTVTTILGFFIAYYIFNTVGEFKDLKISDFYIPVIISLVYIYLFIFFHFVLFQKQYALQIFPNISIKETNILYVIFFIASMLSIIYFINKNGFVLFIEGGYENRYVYNKGMGIVTLMFPLYIPTIILFFFSKPNIKRWYLSLFLALVFGLITYISLGGYRQILVGGIAVIYLIGLNYKYTNMTKIMIFILFMLISLSMLGFLRYQNESTNISIQMFFLKFLFSIFDSLTPLDAFAKIYKSIPDIVEYQYFTVFNNHFLGIVPRFIWEGKPDFLMNSGNFYTKIILEYHRDVTMSPTLNGELFLMGGYIGLLFSLLIIPLTLKLCDLLFLKKDALHQTFFYATIFNTFWLVREGLEVFIYRMILMYILFIFYIIITIFIKNLLYKTL